MLYIYFDNNWFVAILYVICFVIYWILHVFNEDIVDKIQEWIDQMNEDYFPNIEDLKSKCFRKRVGLTMLKKGNYIDKNDPKYAVKLDYFKEKLKNEGIDEESKRYVMRLRFYSVVCHIILSLRRYQSAQKDKLRNARSDAYCDKVIKPIKIEEGSSEEEDKDELAKLKQRDGNNKNLEEEINEDIEMKELKNFELKHSQSKFSAQNVSGKFGEMMEDKKTGNVKAQEEKDGGDEGNDNFNFYGVVQNKNENQEDDKKEIKHKTDLNNFNRSAKNKKKEIFFKIMYVIYFPFVWFWKVTLPEFWVKKNFGIHHIIWGYVVSILHVIILIFFIMSFENNVFTAMKWEPSYFGFLLNGIMFSIGFYMYNISVIYSSMGQYNYYITVLQLTITRFSIIV